MKQERLRTWLAPFFDTSNRCAACPSTEKTPRVFGLCPDCLSRLEWVLAKREETDDSVRFFIYIALFYNNFLRGWFARYKFRAESYLEPFFISLLEEALSHWEEDLSIGWMSAIPMQRSREILRGYNPAQRLCQGLCARRGLLYVHSLEKVRANAEQNKLQRVARAENVRGAFRPAGQTSFAAAYFSHGRWKNVRVPQAVLASERGLLIDDFLTSGSTLRAAQQALRMAGLSADALVLASASYPQETGLPHAFKGLESFLRSGTERKKL